MTGRSLAATCALLCAPGLVLGCGGKGNAPPPVVAKETAEAEVLRISRAWTSTQVEKSLLSPPSIVSVRAQTRTSRLELAAKEGTEHLVIAEQFELRTGGRIECETVFDHPVQVRWGRKSGEAAVEVTRPALQARRTCNGTAPEDVLSEPVRTALFVLGADQLVAVEPPLEERIYRPVVE